MRHLLTISDLTPPDIAKIFEIAKNLKENLAKGQREPILSGRVLALLFEKQSLRTRVSFEAGMTHMGGGSLFLGEDVGWGSRESIADFTHVLSEFVDVIVCRAKSHRRVEELAEHATCPVINGLTDLSHPCQALTDLFTLGEIHGTLQGRKLAYIGDANNVARSLALACGKMEVEFAIAAPKEYQFDEAFLAKLRKETPSGKFSQTTDPREAVQGADGVYTDVWASMGQEAEEELRIEAFTPYQVNAELMAEANKNACFLHCLPAKRGQEVTDEVMDNPNSAIVQQAGNRMHTQKGLLAWLLDAQV